MAQKPSQQPPIEDCRYQPCDSRLAWIMLGLLLTIGAVAATSHLYGYVRAHQIVSHTNNSPDQIITRAIGRA